MKHRRIRPRTDIPDWRDPNMPVQRNYTLLNGTQLGPYVNADYERRFREFKMASYNPDIPMWHNDPTYYGKKSNESRRLSTIPDPRTEGLNSLRDQLPRIQTKSS